MVIGLRHPATLVGWKTETFAARNGGPGGNYPFVQGEKTSEWGGGVFFPFGPLRGWWASFH